MQKKFQQFVDIIKSDPAVATVGGFAGGQATNTGNVFVTLKPPRERGLTTPEVIDRLRPQAAKRWRAPGCSCNPGRPASAPAAARAMATTNTPSRRDTLDDLNDWVPKITEALQDVPELQDVNSDQQDKGLEVDLKIDRATAARLGLNAAQIDNTLYDAFGQRQVSTIYKDKNQYHVVMEVAPAFWQSPETLHDIYRLHLGRRGQRHPVQRGGGRRLCRRNTASTTAAHGSTGIGDHRPPTQRPPAGRPGRGAQPAAQCRGRPGARGGSSTGAIGLDPGRDHGAAVGLCQLRAGHHAACRSIIRACSSPPPSPSACRRASR